MILRYRAAHVLVLLSSLSGLQASVSAQSPAPNANRAQQQPPTKPKAPSAAPDQATPTRVNQLVNVKVDLVLLDSVSGKTIAREQFNSVLADGQLGRVRRRQTPVQGMPVTRIFEVDITPTLVRERILAAITINYSAPAGAGTDDKETITVTQTVSSILESSKPLTVIEAQGDPTSDRRISVQVTATIQK